MLEGDYRDHPGHSYAPVERKSVYWFTRCNRQADVAGRPIACARQRADDPTGASGRGVFLRNKSPTATRWNRSRALMAAARSFEANFGRAIRTVTAGRQTWFHRLGQSAHIQPNPSARNAPSPPKG
jgi:hypothetical protein